MSKSGWLFLRATPYVAAAILVKVLLHFMGWEFLTVNMLFSGLVAANVFLLGFLLTGVLSDFKESEKLPGDLAACIETILDEAVIIHAGKRAPIAAECIEHLHDLAVALHEWFYKRTSSSDIMGRIAGLNRFFPAFEPLAAPPFIARLKSEQSNLRKMVVRVHTIRETSFVTSGYLIAGATTFLLVTGLVFSDMTPFHEAVFFVTVITFLMIFMLNLIGDLDNPFNYYDGGAAENVSLKPLDDLIKRLEAEQAAVRAAAQEDACAD